MGGGQGGWAILKKRDVLNYIYIYHIKRDIISFKKLFAMRKKNFQGISCLASTMINQCLILVLVMPIFPYPVILKQISDTVFHL